MNDERAARAEPPGSAASASLPELLVRIGRMMTSYGIAPTPANFAFCHRIATGADPQLASAVDTEMRSFGRLRPEALAALRERSMGGISPGRLEKWLAAAQEQIHEITERTSAGRGDAAAYSAALTDGRVQLQGADVDRGVAVIAELVAATETMIARTDDLEAKLAAATKELTGLRSALDEARRVSLVDTLTGLPNRKAIDQKLAAEVTAADAGGRPLALGFCDIDHFKRLNDQFGHSAGDEVLRLVGSALSRAVADIGFAGRWGGEEFAVLLPGLSAEQAGALLDRFRRTLAARIIRARGSGHEIGQITVSIGVAELRPGETAESLFARSDKALYDAKTSGRNRVALAD